MIELLIHFISIQNIDTNFDFRAHIIETLIQNKEIVYKLGGTGPKYYDCGGVVTEALEKVGYRGYKINSHFWLMDPSCKQPLSKSKKGDILINVNEGQRHVAFISSNVNKRIKILDFVKTHKRASYRYHGDYPGVFSLNKDCLLSQKYYLKK